jgi:hypothetical protein
LGFGSYTSNRKYLFSVLMIKILQMFARHMRQSVNLGSAAGGVSPLIIYIWIWSSKWDLFCLVMW